MRKLKTLLQFNIFYYILVLIAFIYTFIYVKTYELSNIYELDENEFILTIEEFNIDGDKLSFEFKENLVGIYYIKTEEEKNNIDLCLNDKLYLKGKLELPSNNTIMNTFNYKKYLYYKDIEYILYIDEFYIYEHNNNFFYKIKNFVINRILNIDNEYIYAFILGKTGYIDSEVYDSYKVNGITHLFSLSALHVSVFSSIIYFVLKKMKFNEIVILLFIVIFLVFFSFISSFPVSMLRASIFFFFRKINEIFKLKINVLNLFYLTLVILLFINPMYIFNYGFILSFVITYFILIFSKNSLKSNLLKVSFVSFLASLPIIINMSFEVNIVSFFNNVLFIPFVSYLVFPCSLITFVFFKFDIVLNILISIMEFISNISTSYIKVNVIFSKFSILEILIYYFILYIAIVKYKKFLYILFIFVLFIQIKNRIIFNNFIYFFDVSQGDSALMVMNNKSILIDTGGKIKYEKEEWQSGKKEYVQVDNSIMFFKSVGIRKIDYLILTHGDYDHMGEAINLVENFKVDKVIFNCGEYNELENELVKVLDKKKIKYYSCIKELNIDDNKLYFLNNKDYGNENDNSSVIYTELYNHKFLFMGDAGIEVEEDLIEKYNLMDIDILKVGHHGSKTSSSKKFIDEINPKYSIISVGNNRYGHPNDSVLDNLKDSKIYRTDQDGSIMFEIKNNKLKIETCTP